MASREVEFFHKQIESNIHRAEQGSIILTNFFDETQIAYLKGLPLKNIKIEYDGGFDDAEHMRAMFSPMNLDSTNLKIKVYEIRYNSRYLELNHRKILGCLMNLGIKRESVGDIIHIGQAFFFACTEEISVYIESQFKTISGVPIEVKEVKDRLQIKREIREEKHIVSSLRLDVIIASAYKLSRKEASEMISLGFVQLNHVVCLSMSKQVVENDIISVRHKGRIYVGKIGGKTKSDRLVLQLKFLV